MIPMFMWVEYVEIRGVGASAVIGHSIPLRPDAEVDDLPQVSYRRDRRSKARALALGETELLG
jgi:hypothetical protein